MTRFALLAILCLVLPACGRPGLPLAAAASTAASAPTIDPDHLAMPGPHDVIPIAYGRSGPVMLQAAREGRVHLGGCVLRGRDPQQYCKTHGAEF